MFFSFKKTKIHKAIIFPTFLFRLIFWIFLFIVLFFVFSLVFEDAHIVPLTFTRDELLAWLFISLSFLLLSLSLLLFNKYFLMDFSEKNDLTHLDKVLKDDVNLAEYLTYDAALAIFNSFLFVKRKKLRLTYNVLFLFLMESKRSDFIFKRLLINKEQFKKSLDVIVNSQKKASSHSGIDNSDLGDIMIRSVELAKSRSNKKITFGSIFASIVEKDKVLQNLFFDYGVKVEDVVSVAIWEENYHKEYFVKKSFLDGLVKIQGIADDWVYGYTPVLSQYAKEILVHESKYHHVHVLGREKEIGRMEELLSSSGKNNIVLVGEPGVGRDNILLGFVKRVKRGLVNGTLKYKRVMRLDLNSVLAKSRDFKDALFLLNKIFLEAEKAGNIILVIDDFHNFVGNHDEKDVVGVDISGVIVPFLKSENFQLIAITDHRSYHVKVESNSSLSVLLEKVEVNEPSEKETQFILEDMIPVFEAKSGLFVSYFAIASAVYDSNVYAPNVPYPEKAISLLSEVISYVKSNKGYGGIVTHDHVTEIISKKTGVPLGRVEGEEKGKLLNMEKLLHRRIIGQNKAVSVVSEAMRRLRSGISEREKPIGTFLFLGPTGVGKTETSKAIADVYFGSDEKMIRLDMSEYKESGSIARLIGSVDKNMSSDFTNKVRENPFSLILLDEFEKAHPDIANLLLQVLDEGRLTDAYQRKVSFKNSIIIATSNAGAEFVREYVLSGQNTELLQEKLIDYLINERVFKPEFLNRFDAVVVFEPLKEDEVKRIAKLMLDKLARRLKDRGIKLNVSQESLDKIAQIGFSPVFGAREMRRVIQDKIENKIAEGIINGKYSYGSEVDLDPNDI